MYLCNCDWFDSVQNRGTRVHLLYGIIEAKQGRICKMASGDEPYQGLIKNIFDRYKNVTSSSSSRSIRIKGTSSSQLATQSYLACFYLLLKPVTRSFTH
ncbi:hypothetical protein IEQ34_008989 [Dendrobium chrysotoxum]|uniref:LAGLIDADG homing endonuclease n=1 Tax=Dendrobium chrysotoxum TaxID=161865 RepID=A0AAV7GI22_DENCH|nr:hypothetical protein IEQ34_008989 [Dendrobium chrysotoxum]